MDGKIQNPETVTQLGQFTNTHNVFVVKVIGLSSSKSIENRILGWQETCTVYGQFCHTCHTCMVFLCVSHMWSMCTIHVFATHVLHLYFYICNTYIGYTSVLNL